MAEDAEDTAALSDIRRRRRRARKRQQDARTLRDRFQFTTQFTTFPFPVQGDPSARGPGLG